MSVSDVFQAKGYVPYISQDFYSKNTFIVKQGRNAEHINSAVNGKNSGWPNAAHIVLPFESRNINVISEAQQGTILNYLETKFNESRNETFIYQPCIENNCYQRFKIWLNQFKQCVIIKDGEPGILNSIIPVFENEAVKQTESASNIFSAPNKDDPSSPYSLPPAQIIYYGVPGCGKSNKITNLLEAAKLNGEIANEELQVERVVFHPEYTNADFVGQVRPVVKPGEGVNYDFVAGPFTRILARAYANPTKPYYLIIEEINRGNAAAIFGEIFQLLDRHKKGESDSVGGNTYTAGWSKYFVDHEDVNGIIRKEISKTSYEKDADKPTIKFTENTAIRLPPNLSIYATMNTSDQNVFTLDNAFKRRFDFELVKNSLEGEEHTVQRETKIEDTNITWGAFWESVNELILENHSAMTSFEDKRLGAYFIVGEDKGDGDSTCREISKKLFAEKVLEYLWDDAFKYKRKEVFQDDCKSIEQLIEKFTAGGFSDVFKNLEFRENANER